MPDKWTTTSARKEFLRRERDILNKHRMERDINTDYQELVNQTQNNQLTNEGMPIADEEMA